MRPQENGNRCDVRFLEITDKSGAGIRIDNKINSFVDAYYKGNNYNNSADREITAWDGMNFSVHMYSQEALDMAEHIFELRDSGHIHLHVDAKVCGVGGSLKMIAGILKPTRGSIIFNKHPWKRSDLSNIGASICSIAR